MAEGKATHCGAGSGNETQIKPQASSVYVCVRVGWRETLLVRAWLTHLRRARGHFKQ